MQVHTFDHTLSQAVQDAVASTPGISFHPWGVGSPSKGEGVHDFQTLKTFRADAFRCLVREPHCTLEVLVIQTV